MNFILSLPPKNMWNVQEQFAERDRMNWVKEKMEREAEFKGRDVIRRRAQGRLQSW